MHDGMATGGGSAMTHHHGAHAAPPSDRSPADAGQHACTCLGHCCGAAPAVEPPAVAVRPALSQAVAPGRTPGRPQHEYVAAWVDFVLPFSTAPPRA
jgi:hypothetical protein